MRQGSVIVGVAVLVSLLAIATWFRVARLQTTPGINGDEAWYGVQAMNLLAGRPVAWRTPTGVPLNPFFVGIEVLLLAVFEPAFWILRAPAVLSGLLAVGLTYALGTRGLDRTTALIATILLAASPIAIGYSRFGWDASQTPLFSLVALMLALRGHLVATAIAFLACLVVHPTNVFLLPALALPLGMALWRQGRRRLVGWLVGAVGATLAAGLLAALVIHVQRGPGETAAEVASRLLARLPVGETIPAVVAKGVDAASKPLVRATGGGTPADALRRWLDPVAMGTYLSHFSRLLSGITLYEYIVGPVPTRVVRLHDWAFGASVIVLLGLGLRRLWLRRHWERLALAAGLVASAIGIYVVGGPRVFAPHSERYGIFLVVPSLVVLACLIRSLMPEAGERLLAWDVPATRRWLGGVAAVGGLFLLSFHLNYLTPLRRTGGESHVAFRTSRVEPKQRAYERILRSLPKNGGPPQTRILTEDWWSYRPIEFLASDQNGIQVENTQDILLKMVPTPGSRLLDDLRRLILSALDEDAYAVGFAGALFDRMLREVAPAQSLLRWTIPDRAGRELIVIYHRNGNRGPSIPNEPGASVTLRPAPAASTVR